MSTSKSVQKLLVVGGNGFLGSAVCKAAVAKGWEVDSISSSGKAYTTPAGHIPKWVNSVTWHSASAFSPETYRHLMRDKSAVVHTLGILLESPGYKDAVKNGSVSGLIKALIGSEMGNPLKSELEKRKGYEGMNRDSALTVLDTYLTSIPSSSSTSTSSRSFVYISAADAFRPLVPARYLETKREAEFEITRRCAASQNEQVTGQVRPIFVRPGLMYHPHIRPFTTLPAFIIDLTSKMGLPTNFFASKSLLSGAMSAMSTPPLHVDHVAGAVIRAIEDERKGVLDVNQMREWAGFTGTKVGGKLGNSKTALDA